MSHKRLYQASTKIHQQIKISRNKMTLKLTRYIRATEENEFIAAIAYTIESDQDGNTVVYGAYFGSIV